jgi:hypothetical protein
MKRDALITVLLVIAGILLAFVLFGAGAFWKGRTSPGTPGHEMPQLGFVAPNSFRHELCR